jgi:hypothetical protein
MHIALACLVLAAGLAQHARLLGAKSLLNEVVRKAASSFETKSRDVIKVSPNLDCKTLRCDTHLSVAPQSICQAFATSRMVRLGHEHRAIKPAIDNFLSTAPRLRCQLH